jgi:type IV pilus assembly protein PilY1
MLHAINAGFYDAELRKFCRTEACELDASGDELNTANTAVLGEEMWAYVPYNLLPHLSCLTDPDYVHKYYVDLRPRIFDVQIFNEEGACGTDYEDPGCIHPGGWGTILVGGMRFGGAPVNASDISGDAGDTRVFKSAYFILDITNPEKVPTLLGETTFTNTKEDLDDDGVLDTIEDDGLADSGVFDNADGVLDGEISLGYTLAIPTMVPMNDGTDTTWYLILGSGPTLPDPTSALEGKSDQGARLAVIPLHDRMNPASLKSLRIPQT